MNINATSPSTVEKSVIPKKRISADLNNRSEINNKIIASKYVLK